MAQRVTNARWYFHVVWFPGTTAVTDPNAKAPSMYLQQPQFDVLNTPGADGRGHFIVLPQSDRFPAVREAGNGLAGYCNDFHAEKSAAPSFTHQQPGTRPSNPDGTPPVVFGMSAAERAEAIASTYSDTFVQFNKPRWVFLNEISRFMWMHYPKYPAWLADLTRQLTDAGFRVVLFSQIAKPDSVPAQVDKLRATDPKVKQRTREQNARDWATISQYAFIAVEAYLPGRQILNGAQKVGVSPQEWCTARYQDVLHSYAAVGVPKSRLFLCEHFGQTTGTERGGPRGRAGVTDEEWQELLVARSQAANDLVPGYVTYGWQYNTMLASENQLVAHAQTFVDNAPRLLPKPAAPRPTPRARLSGSGVDGPAASLDRAPQGA